MALTDAMVDQGYIELDSDAGLVTEPGIRFLAKVGIDAVRLEARRGKGSGRLLCRPCLATGANAGRIWPAPSARRFAPAVSTKAGFAASKERAPSRSRPKVNGCFANSSARRSHDQAMEMAMTLTVFIRYQLDPFKRNNSFEGYARRWL